ncbi:YdeI/OmpD-associated family protein [Lysobacter sp. P5_B9]
MPDDLAAALKKNARARATFDAFPPSCRREYVEWITEAKREETRARRLEQAVEWMAEGKRRNWKYENC